MNQRTVSQRKLLSLYQCSIVELIMRIQITTSEIMSVISTGVNFVTLVNLLDSSSNKLNLPSMEDFKDVEKVLPWGQYSFSLEKGFDIEIESEFISDFLGVYGHYRNTMNCIITGYRSSKPLQTTTQW